jgi:hypothetical protein
VLLRALILVAATVMLLGSHPASAVELYAADGYDLRWDNDLRYSAGFRLDAPSAITLNYPNSDDGDRDFAPGLMMNRLDLVSVLDLTGDAFGAQLSLEAWYDSVYQRHSDNKSPSTYNPLTVSNRQFAPAAATLDGRDADLGDSFAYGNVTLDGMPLSVRIGRQTLLWGESLFFDQNGIAAGMAPVDYIKKASTPDGYSREVFLPVNQVSFTAQPAPDLSLAGYYQLEWRADRLPGVGSYFSETDVQGAGAGRAFFTQGQYLLHVPDRDPPAGGQFGISLHKTIDDLDLGLYALRYHAKYPVLAVQTLSPAANGYAGTFDSVYPAGTDLYGASFSTYLGDSNVAGEFSLRRHMPLVSLSPISLMFPSPVRNDTGYAEGNTVQGQVSSVTTLGPGILWDSADLSMEIAANDLLSLSSDAAAFNPSRTRFAASARLLFQPHYFQLLPNLDITPVFSVGYNLSGRSATDYTQNAGTGDIELGLSGTYLSVWKADLTLTTFIGVAYRQPLADRDFVMLSLERAL